MAEFIVFFDYRWLIVMPVLHDRRGMIMLRLYECKGSIVWLPGIDYCVVLIWVQAVDCVVIVRLQGIDFGVPVVWLQGFSVVFVLYKWGGLIVILALRDCKELLSVLILLDGLRLVMVMSDCSGLILALFPVLATTPPTLIQCLCEIQRSVQWKNTESKDLTVNYI